MMAVFTATSDGAVEYIPGLRLNANQQPVLDHYLSKNTTTRGTAKPLLTLNLEARRREFKRIVSENNLMLHRLESSQSQYSREKWAEQYAELQHRQKYMAKDGTIGYLPPVATRPSTTAAAGSRVRLPKMTSERTSASAPMPTMHRSQTASSPSRDFPEPSPAAAAAAGVPSPGRILFVTVRSVDGVEPVHLVVREVPYDDAADTAIPAASALVVACTRDEAMLCSPVEIPFTKLAYFVQDSAAADDLRYVPPPRLVPRTLAADLPATALCWVVSQQCMMVPGSCDPALFCPEWSNGSSAASCATALPSLLKTMATCSCSCVTRVLLPPMAPRAVLQTCCITGITPACACTVPPGPRPRTA